MKALFPSRGQGFLLFVLNTAVFLLYTFHQKFDSRPKLLTISI